MGIILVCGDAHFTKFLNQRQDVSLSLLKIWLKWASLSIGNDKIIFKKCSGVGSFDPYAISQENYDFLPVEHCMYVVEQCSRFSFDAAILLGSTWISIFELHPHHLLFASQFEINIFTCIVKAQVLDLNVILFF